MKNMQCNIPDEQGTEEFLRLLMANHMRIYAFILTLVPVSVDADDLMQETTTVMWKKFAQFRQGTDFVAWGINIAHKNIMEYRRKKARSKLKFSDDVFDMIQSESQSAAERSQRRLEILNRCVMKLTSQDRKLISKRYEKGWSVKDLAELAGRSIYSIYRSFARIHDVLIRCMRRTLAEEEVL